MKTSSFFAAVVLLLAAQGAAQDTGESKTKSYRIFGQLTSQLERNLAENESNEFDVDYTKFKQLATFNIEWSKITIGAEAEYLYWSVPFEYRDPLDFDRNREGFELRKYYLEYQSDVFKGRLGTFFSSFGRGLTLYVQKNEALKFDEPVHGATASFTFKNVDITVLGGRVAEPILQNQYGDDFVDEVMGGRILARLPLDLYVGASFARAELDRFFPAGSIDDVDVWSVEGGGNSLWGVLDLAGEVSEISKVENDRTKDGYGRYFSAAAYVGPVSILGEYKDYYNFDYRYNQPPSAGRSNERYDHADVKGPRLLVSADIFATGTLLHASYASFDKHNTSASPVGNEQIEWYGGLEQTIGRVYFELGYFNRDWIDLGVTEEHTTGDFHVTVGRSGEIILGYDKRLEELPLAKSGTTRTTLAYSHSPWGTVSLRYAWEDKSNPTGSETEDFWGFEVQYLPTPKLILTVFGGSEPGGLVCAGGQCRIEPRFKGLRANFTWRF